MGQFLKALSRSARFMIWGVCMAQRCSRGIVFSTRAGSGPWACLMVSETGSAGTAAQWLQEPYISPRQTVTRTRGGEGSRQIRACGARFTRWTFVLGPLPPGRAATTAASRGAISHAAEDHAAGGSLQGAGHGEFDLF